MTLWRAIEGLLEHLRPPTGRVDRWPDQEERTRPEIDAVAGPYAIEHTRLDSFPGQSEDTNFFEALASLERKLRLTYRLSVYVPVGALRRGADWHAIVQRVERWLVEMLRGAVTRKVAKLSRYRTAGFITLLLLETRCVALMSAARLHTALGHAFPQGLPTGVEQVWFADWSCESVPTHRRLR